MFISAQTKKGYLEGAMTQKRIYQQYTNIHSVFWHNATTIPASLQAWLKAQVRGGLFMDRFFSQRFCSHIPHSSA
jgi:hypothetical protein